MKNRRKYLVLMCVVFLFTIFSACSYYEGTAMSYLESDVNSLELAVYIGNYDDLCVLISRGLSVDELNEQIGFGSIKTESYGYRTTVNSDKGFVLIYFDTNQISIGHKLIQFSGQEFQANVESVECGMSVADIQKLDPDGDYTFLLSSWSQYPKVSYHFFENGLAYEIYYSDEQTVASIYKYIV